MLTREQQEAGWLLRCGWAPYSRAGRTFCATCAVAVCVIPSPKMASKPFTEWITMLFFGADLLFCHSLVLNVLDFQGLAVCDPINLSDVTERNQLCSCEEAGEAWPAPHLAMDTAWLCIAECFSWSWWRLQQGIICGAVSMVFFLPQPFRAFWSQQTASGVKCVTVLWGT